MSIKLFISYSNEDGEVVASIINQLPKLVDVWIDKERLLIGEDIKSKLNDVITTKTDFVLLFLSEKSINSEWVRKEIKYAMALENKICRNIILPVMIGENEDLIKLGIEHLNLKNRKYLKFLKSGNQNITEFVNQLNAHLVGLISSGEPVAIPKPKPRKSIKKTKRLYNYILVALIVTFVSIILGLKYLYNKPEMPIILFGSGTVRRFLLIETHKLYQKVRSRLIEGNSKRAKDVYNDTLIDFQDNEKEAPFSLIILRSSQLKDSDIEDAEVKLFQITIGEDPLIVILTAAEDGPKLEDIFGKSNQRGLPSLCSPKDINIDNLFGWVSSESCDKKWTSLDYGYEIWHTSEGTGTLTEFKEKLETSSLYKGTLCWPDSFEKYTYTEGLDYKSEKKIPLKNPRLVLGSNYLNSYGTQRADKAENNTTQVKFLINNQSERYYRKLYIYGTLPKETTGIEKQQPKYLLGKTYSWFIKELFKELKDKKWSDEMNDIIKKQIEYFHVFNSEECYIDPKDIRGGKICGRYK